MRRTRRLLVLGTLLPSILLAPVGASASIPKAITWRIDHDAKTIKVTVNLWLYPACSGDEAVCEIDDIMASDIEERIEKIWNKGYSYRCYRLIFEAFVVFDNTTDRFTVPDDWIGVRIDQSVGGFRSFVSGVGPLSTDWQSDDPSDKWVPTNDVLSPTTWWWPPSHDWAFAHEFGHILGLDDTYIEGEDGVQPGAPEDLMSDKAPDIDQSTIDRLVKRSGVIKDSDLRCDYKVDYQAANGWTLKGKKCDRPEGEWTLTMGGSGSGVSWSGKMSFTLYAPELSGQVGGRWHGDLGGGATTDGIWTGIARYVAGDPPTIVIPSQSPGEVCVPGLGCKQGTSFGKATLVLEVGKFC